MPSVYQTNTAPPIKKKPVGAVDSYEPSDSTADHPDGAEPQRDEFGRVIITKNVIVTVNPKQVRYKCFT